MKSKVVASAVVVALVVGAARADVFNMPSGQKSLEFVTVGDPGNAGEQSRLAYGDSTYYGAVPYSYQMGKYDVTAAQYCQFLNAVAKTDTYGVYTANMGSWYPDNWHKNIGISRTGDPGNYSYAIMGSYSEAANTPVFGVTWACAARFCNWVQNGQPSGDQGPGTTETGAYSLDGAITNDALRTIVRSAGAKYFLPSEDEWYKAAFYKGGGTNAGYWLYPTQGDTAPSNLLSSTGTNNANYYDGVYTDPVTMLTPVGTFAGSPGPYGTYDMAGNLWQWNEAIINNSTSRGLRGGDSNLSASYLVSSYRSYNSPAADGWSTVGFRLASIPEPSSIVLLVLGAFGLASYAWRRYRVE